MPPQKALRHKGVSKDIECLNVLMLEWLAQSNHSNNQALRQSINLNV